MHDELGVETVRAHGILDDDLGVYREVDDKPVYDWTGIDRVYDTVLALGMRPIVELGFMPRDLASDPSRTVFTYRGIISPPKDWDRWADLVRALVVAPGRPLRPGRGARRLGVRGVERGQPVGVLVGHARRVLAALRGEPPAPSRTSTRACGSAARRRPRSAGSTASSRSTRRSTSCPRTSTAARRWTCAATVAGPAGRCWWTEWGVTATHGNQINDTVFAATFLLRGMRSAAGRIESLAPWVASDHFEELGRPPRLLHGGFGLLTVGNLAKPKFWALWLAQRLGDTAAAGAGCPATAPTAWSRPGRPAVPTAR